MYKIRLHRSEDFYHHYYIYNRINIIGEITFKKKKNIILLQWLGIYPQYRKQHYEYQIIEYLLSHYKVDCIVGQSLKESRTFWNKCIRKYNGQRKNITTFPNCSSSFVIPKQKINSVQMEKLLIESESV